MRKIGFLAATIAAAAALCAACGSSAAGSGTYPTSAGPRTSSAGTSGAGASLSSGSVPDVCKLVPLAAVRAVLGDSFNSATSSADLSSSLGRGICTYGSSSSIIPVQISVFPFAYPAGGQFISGKATPFDGLGHLAECGPGGVVVSADQSSLVAAIGSDDVVNVVGPSCSADGKLAQDVYSALAS